MNDELMRLHLQNRATHWNDDGTLNLVWCVVTESGERLSRWSTFDGAEKSMTLLITNRRFT